MWPNAVARGFSRLAQEFRGRSADRLVGLLLDQVTITERGANLVVSLAENAISAQAAHAAMRGIEHDGDAARARLVTELSGVLVTPIDAEDIFRLSRSIDDILDNLRDFVREVDLYRPRELDFAASLTATLEEGVVCLRSALFLLAAPEGQARDAALGARKASGRVRRLYQKQLGELLNRPLDNETLKRRELLRRLDVVGLRLSEAADALADGALKRSR